MRKKYFELDDFPEIKTERLVLDSVKLSDSMALLEIFRDEEIAAKMDIEPLTNLDDAVALIKLWRSYFRSRNRLRWAIRLQGDLNFIGSIGFRYIFNNAEAEIGFELHPNMHRKGIMSEALNGVCEYGFKKLNLRKISAEVLEDNEASIKLLEKSNFMLSKKVMPSHSSINSKDILRFTKMAESINGVPSI